MHKIISEAKQFFAVKNKIYCKILDVNFELQNTAQERRLSQNKLKTFKY